MTKVYFRKYKESGEILAVFPDLIADAAGNIMAYEHIGQHGAASLDFIKSDTVAALKSEYGSLLHELETLVGYDDLKIIDGL